MAMSAGQSGDLTAEPNVTPMIDVLLVLLIIFMLLVPMSRRAIDLQLPEPTPPQTQAAPDNKQIVLEVAKDGSFQINRSPVSAADLERRLHEIYDPRPDKIIFIKGDPSAKYQQIIHAMDVARGAGVKVIGVPPKEVK